MLLPAQSTAVISTKFQGLWQSQALYIATLHNPSTGFVIGRLAIVAINNSLTCQVAVINGAPFDIQLVRGDFIRAGTTLHPQAAKVQPIKALPIATISCHRPEETIQPHELRNSKLAQAPNDRIKKL